jgi:hypothetical protein
MEHHRRQSCAVALAFPARTSAGQEGAMSKTKSKESEPEISAPEDLMREDGMLNRILLIYEGVRRLRAGEDMPPQGVPQAGRAR